MRSKTDHQQDTCPPLMMSDRDLKPLEALNWDALGLYWAVEAWLIAGGNGWRMELPKNKLLQAVQRRRPLKALEAAAAELVEEGIWEDAGTCWRVLLHRQPDIDDWRDPVRRERDLRRKRLHRDSDLIRRIKERDRLLCRYCGVRTRWDNDQKSRVAGTFDHVDPDGDNSFENVVVACRHCNCEVKKDRTLEQAGMSLYAPGTTIEDIASGRARLVGRNSVRASVPERKARSDLGQLPPPGDADPDPIPIRSGSGTDSARARPRLRTGPDRIPNGSGSATSPAGGGAVAPEFPTEDPAYLESLLKE